MTELRYDNKVALVTGAGAGLGRQYALMLARRGAKVVVNDLGGATDGTGASTRAADAVVEEIRGSGGVATADYHSVVDGDKIVQTALDAYGRIDIVVNNAGILRDVSFLKMDEAAWDIVFDVHVKGTFRVCKAAWPHMRNNKYGRIINVTSTSGLYGNFGQANYSAAKMAVVGLASTLAKEGAKYNIKVNTVAPGAGSRLTASVMPQDMLDLWKPEYVAPMVAFLSHEDCPVTGQVLQAGGGWFSLVTWQRSDGHLVNVHDAQEMAAMTPEGVRAQWPAITSVPAPAAVPDQFGGTHKDHQFDNLVTSKL